MIYIILRLISNPFNDALRQKLYHLWLFQASWSIAICNVRVLSMECKFITCCIFRSLSNISSLIIHLNLNNLAFLKSLISSLEAEEILMNCILSVVQFVQPTEPDEIRVISRYILIACLSHCRARDISGTQLKECHHPPSFSKVSFPMGCQSCTRVLWSRWNCAC